jgi:hypothetical protein
MLNLGVNLLIFSIVSGLLLNLVMLVKYFSRSRQLSLAIGEIFHTFITGYMLKSYRELLIKDGIRPTTLDELLHCVSILLLLSGVCGLALPSLGLTWGS